MNEIFRHLRPKIGTWPFAKNDPKGGVSFLAIRRGQVADYWVYLCPLNVTFSHKAAIFNLRKSRAAGVMPWGEVVLDGTPLIENLCTSAVSQKDLHSEIDVLIDKIIKTHK
jgi:hypothetical protein